MSLRTLAAQDPLGRWRAHPPRRMGEAWPPRRMGEAWQPRRPLAAPGHDARTWMAHAPPRRRSR